MDVIIARTFLAAAEAGSFTAAAVRVHASPSAVTDRIKQLELLLGARLFERDKRGCRLTRAGTRLIEPAQSIVRAWELARARVNLPARFTETLRIGGQHALWPSLLIPWLNEVAIAEPRIAIRAIAAAPAQLNRALVEEDLDMAFLYDPIMRKGIRIEELTSDRLILVAARPDMDWRANFARFDWGENASAEISARLDDMPATGLELDLGILSLDWLVDTGSAGFVPERLASPYLKDGHLTRIEGIPNIEFSPFVCWRASLDRDLVDSLVHRARARLDDATALVD